MEVEPQVTWQNKVTIDLLGKHDVPQPYLTTFKEVFAISDDGLISKRDDMTAFDIAQTHEGFPRSVVVERNDGNMRLVREIMSRIKHGHTAIAYRGRDVLCGNLHWLLCFGRRMDDDQAFIDEYQQESKSTAVKRKRNERPPLPEKAQKTEDTKVVSSMDVVVPATKITVQLPNQASSYVHPHDVQLHAYALKTLDKPTTFILELATGQIATHRACTYANMLESTMVETAFNGSFEVANTPENLENVQQMTSLARAGFAVQARKARDRRGLDNTFPYLVLAFHPSHGKRRRDENKEKTMLPNKIRKEEFTTAFDRVSWLPTKLTEMHQAGDKEATVTALQALDETRRTTVLRKLEMVLQEEILEMSDAEHKEYEAKLNAKTKCKSEAAALLDYYLPGKKEPHVTVNVTDRDASMWLLAKTIEIGRTFNYCIELR